MKKEDNNTAIKAMFNVLRRQDDIEQIPSFEAFVTAQDPKLVSVLARRRWYKLSMAAAAVIGVAWLSYYMSVPKAGIVAPEEIVILIELPDNTNDTFEASASSVFEWEASSDFLISDMK